MNLDYFLFFLYRNPMTIIASLTKQHGRFNPCLFISVEQTKPDTGTVVLLAFGSTEACPMSAKGDKIDQHNLLMQLKCPID